MTLSERPRVTRLSFDAATVRDWRDPDGRHHDWPVVYMITDSQKVYVGETTRARHRLRQHLDHPSKAGLREVRVVIDEEFNKSACLDLESRLIALFHADGAYAPLNRNDGQQDSGYFERTTRYQPLFDKVFDRLRTEGVFLRSVDEIENLNLFKLSPYKALNDEQLVAVDGIVEGLLEDLTEGRESASVVRGGPGTGKTVVAIFLLKLLRDIQDSGSGVDPSDDGRFSDFFLDGNRELLDGLRIGFVVPQQSLRKTITSVFRRTPGLKGVTVLSPYTVAASPGTWDLLVVDEAHRLTHRGAGPTRGAFSQRNRDLFGEMSEGRTAVDWISTKSTHQIYLVDGDQTVRPADVSRTVVDGLVARASADHRFYELESQMRVSAGQGYLGFARALLTDSPAPARVPTSYDLRFFDHLGDMKSQILERESEVGLSRLVAGYAWRWTSKGDVSVDAPHDISEDGVELRWNRTDTDWISSQGSIDEVGSVHTVQGYDLNYAGVIIGPDIVWDEDHGGVRAVRESHFDREVRSVRDEHELLEYIRNAYYVLLTRGMKGTYVYVCDPALRERVRAAISAEHQ